MVSPSLDLDIKRESILSLHKHRQLAGADDKKRIAASPSDPFHLVHVIFFFFGIGHLIPNLFFLTAQDYWMYKFRDVSQPDYDLNNKTILQQNFMALSSVVNTVPSLISNLVSTRYGHKINIKTRLIGTNMVTFIFFVIFTAFVKINTDTWQMGFFVLTMAVSCALMVNGSLLMVTSLTLISRFPLTYMKTNQYATAVAGIISALLQIISLATGGDSSSVALIYFSCGTFLIAVTALFSYVCFHVPRFVYFLGDTVADTEKPTQSWAEFKSVSKQMWPNVVMAITGVLFSGLSGKNVTAMVVSEDYPRTLWTRKYFIPVINFLLADIVGLVARYFSGPYMTPKNAVYVVIIDFVRLVAVGPLLIFCNLKTTNRHLPTLFPHDWQYILIYILYNFLHGFFMTSSMMSTANMVPEDPEQGFLFMSAVGGTIMPLSSPLNALWVNIV